LFGASARAAGRFANHPCSGSFKFVPLKPLKLYLTPESPPRPQPPWFFGRGISLRHSFRLTRPAFLVFTFTVYEGPRRLSPSLTVFSLSQPPQVAFNSFLRFRRLTFWPLITVHRGRAPLEVSLFFAAPLPPCLVQVFPPLCLRWLHTLSRPSLSIVSVSGPVSL